MSGRFGDFLFFYLFSFIYFPKSLEVTKLICIFAPKEVLYSIINQKIK